MGDSDLLFWGFILWAFSRQTGDRQGGEAPAPSPSSPPADIGEGWWWYWFPTSVSDQYQAALAKELRRSKRNKSTRRWEVRKTIGGTALGATVVVFYVFEPFKWELPGLPEPAPRGFDTDLSDVAWAIPEPPSALRQLAQVIAHETWEYLREIAEGRRPPRQPFP